MEEKELKGLAKLRHDLKPMPFKKKVEHLWTYYRWVIIVVVMFCLLISMLSSMYINANTKTLLAGLYINTWLDDTARGYLETDFQAKYTTGVKWEKLRLKEVVLEAFNKTQDIEGNQYTLTNIHALFASQELDYIIADQEGLETVWPTDQADEAFTDLREFFTPEELEKLTAEGKMLYKGGAETGVPLAVEVSDIPLIREHFQTGDELVFFCVVTNSPRKELTRTFWDYLNAWEAE